MSLHIEVDPASPVPLYVQIVERVRQLVATGALRSGDRLPTVREMAATARVNRNTAARAVQALEAAGVVRTRVGQGTFVVDGRSHLDAASRDAVLDAALDRLLVEAHGLGVPLEELGWRLGRRIDVFRRHRAEREGS